MSIAFDHDDFADLDVDPDLDQDDEPNLDDALDELTAEELAAALDSLYAGRNPLAFYATPVTRRSKPAAYGRTVVDVLPTL
ncbi:hypothetical protein ACFWHV_32320 [Streptomyces collinus]|uniref:hypothetical protein n=1 Tax=Streptomyces collinus TaxID=42684 RepID=UPI0036628F50